MQNCQSSPHSVCCSCCCSPPLCQSFSPESWWGSRMIATSTVCLSFWGLSRNECCDRDGFWSTHNPGSEVLRSWLTQVTDSQQLIMSSGQCDGKHSTSHLLLVVCIKQATYMCVYQSIQELNDKMKPQRTWRLLWYLPRLSFQKHLIMFHLTGSGTI